jgi:hypothetical protein
MRNEGREQFRETWRCSFIVVEFLLPSKLKALDLIPSNNRKTKQNSNKKLLGNLAIYIQKTKTRLISYPVQKSTLNGSKILMEDLKH